MSRVKKTCADGGKDRDTLVDLTDTFASLEGVVSIDVREPVEFVKHRQNLISLV